MSDKKLRKFKLIDREGYFDAFETNEVDFLRHGKGDCFVGHIDGCEDLIVEGVTVISGNEFEYFDEVTMKDTAPIYWDGKDTKDIEVGMIVMYEGESAECTVLFVASDKVVVDFNEVTTLHKDRLGSAQPTPRELAFTRFLSEWQKQSLDCAHDDASTVASLKKVFEFAYDTIVEEE